MKVDRMGLRECSGVIAHRVAAAVCTLPSKADWLRALGLLILFALVALPTGYALGFLRFDPVKSWRTAAGVLATTLLFPALAEEFLFRALLPHPSERASSATKWLWVTLSLAAFVIAHPLRAIGRCGPGRRILAHPVFLLLAALLGLTCTLAYLGSGSLWPPAAIHWFVVAVWVTLMGGYRKLQS
jgi:predicted Abi (CAAX) family protease